MAVAVHEPRDNDRVIPTRAVPVSSHPAERLRNDRPPSAKPSDTKKARALKEPSSFG
jgi:hypothetical protein